MSPAQQLLSYMPTRAEEFTNVLNHILRDDSVRSSAIKELGEIARNPGIVNRTKAVEILGAIKAKEVEPILAELMTTEFPIHVRAVWKCGSQDVREDKLLFLRLMTALLLLNLEKWRPVADNFAKEFSGSWLEGALQNVVHAVDIKGT